MRGVVPNLEDVLKETKSAHVVIENGQHRVVNQDGGLLASFDTEQLANEWMRDTLRGKQYFVASGDRTVDRLADKDLKAGKIDLRQG